ncbi:MULTISPECIES: serine/threonine-protein kinase [unclassified Streptomyces]|uniref:serine/threonine-protein kinase n=1 Tax=unclassified Streptomyces TaxID=2593676 RepID=UPI0019080587|nr:serine/threonine-protein kinase [Streptomyces sp. HSG2]
MVTEGDGGRVIAGRYRLGERLGSGGMGVVWRATDALLGREVAVKALPLADPSEPRTASGATTEALRRRERTLREARAVARLSHPHIIVVHDVVEDEGRAYIVMELIDGGSLADRLVERGTVRAGEAARIGLALLGALRTAHSAGVLHRDVKPSNVLIADDGRVVLTDFGVAHVEGATTLTETGTFVGSPEYTAPERMSGTGTGPASDLWSLGALLCTALSGESPFRRDSLGGIVRAVVDEAVQAPAQAAPLAPVVRGLLERDPARRLDAEEAEGMLRAFLATGRTPRRPGDERVPRRARRGLLLAVLLAAATVAAGVGTAILLTGDPGGAGGGAPSTSVPDSPSPTPADPPPVPAPSAEVGPPGVASPPQGGTFPSGGPYRAATPDPAVPP